jgi:hypothetical protein
MVMSYKSKVTTLRAEGSTQEQVKMWNNLHLQNGKSLRYDRETADGCPCAQRIKHNAMKAYGEWM